MTTIAYYLDSCKWEMFAFPFIGSFTVNKVVHNIGEINQYKEHYYVVVEGEVGPDSFTKGFNLITNEIYS